MKKVSLITLVLSLTALFNANAAPSAENLKAANELAEAMGITNQMAEGFDAMMPLIQQQSNQMGLDAADSQELLKIYKAWYTEDLDHASIERRIVSLYAESFTTDELVELKEFYETPLGAKALSLLPQLTESGMRIGMEEGQLKEQALVQRLEPFFAALQAKQAAEAATEE